MTAPTSSTVADMLLEGTLLEAVAQAFPRLSGGAVDDVAWDVVRTVDAGGDLVFEVASPTARIHAIWGDSAAATDRAEALRRSLAKPSRGQLRPGQESGPMGVDRLGVVLVPAGLDRRIPALALLADPSRFPELTARVGRGASTELLAHRYRKRAVLRVIGERGSVIVKAYKARSGLVEETAEWGRALVGLVPAPLDVVGSAVIWSDLGEKPPDWPDGQWSRPSATSTATAAECLVRLHGAMLSGVPVHGPDDEVGVLDRSVRLLRRVRPAFSGLAEAARDRATRELRSLLPAEPVPIHRDAHPGQFRPCERIVDLDTLSVGDRAVDLGNYSAHLRLAGDDHLVETLLDTYGVDDAMARRIRSWECAATARLAMQCVLTTDRFEVGVEALDRLGS